MRARARAGGPHSCSPFALQLRTTGSGSAAASAPSVAAASGSVAASSALASSAEQTAASAAAATKHLNSSRPMPLLCARVAFLRGATVSGRAARVHAWPAFELQQGGGGVYSTARKWEIRIVVIRR